MEKINNGSGIGFCGLLTILFIGLKLANFINWSWWWVLAPLWLPFSFILICIFIVSTIALIKNF